MSHKLGITGMLWPTTWTDDSTLSWQLKLAKDTLSTAAHVAAVVTRAVQLKPQLTLATS
jgi:hypothetical protein